MSGYSIYTREFDEIIHAKDLVSEKEMDALHSYMQQQNKNSIEGTTTNPPSFTSSSSTGNTQNVGITLLLDNSGSLRGKGIQHVVEFATMTGQFCDRLNVPLEILGFTTKAWKGGEARQAWLAAGRKLNPGRLNDTRHIIYKSADESWEDAQRNIAIMYKEGLLKENIDGEALEWAYQRSQEQDTKRRIIIHVSDGAPIDDSTLSANHAEILKDHFDEVSARVMNSAVELYNIGVNYKIQNFHDPKLIISDRQSSQMVFDHLIQKITNKKQAKMDKGFPTPKRKLII